MDTKSLSKLSHCNQVVKSFLAIESGCTERPVTDWKEATLKHRSADNSEYEPDTLSKNIRYSNLHIGV